MSYAPRPPVWILLALLLPAACAKISTTATRVSSCLDFYEPGVGTRKVCYENAGGMAVVEDDIVLGEVAELERVSGARGAIAFTMGSQYRWPNRTVPYAIDGTAPNPRAVTDAIAHYQSRTSIRFVPWSGTGPYVRFVGGTGVATGAECDSRLGMVARGSEAQLIRMKAGCNVGSLIHEIGHALGLYHEHMRLDRDLHVTVYPENMSELVRQNFLQPFAWATDLGAYDLASIMHYGSGSDIAPWMTKKDGSLIQPNRAGLSAGDISGLETLYSDNFIDAPTWQARTPPFEVVSPTSLRFFFVDRSSSELEFRLEYAVGAGAWSELVIPSTSGAGTAVPLEGTVSSLLSSTRYRFRLRAMGRAADGSEIFSPYSSEAEFTTPLAPPGAPGLNVTLIAPTEVRFDWQAPSGPVTRIHTEMKAGAAAWTEWGNQAPTATTLNVGGLQPQTVYRFRAKARNAAGDSPYSAERTVTTGN